ncbi:DUF1491 family protein [Magnetospirillum aberrantis]|uniref:DUF1491 family protein n=1 Tax=Magnetospirillum aberrantis TaxID=1105283 RepID=UPI0013D05D19
MASEPKLKAKLFVHAAIRRCGIEAIPAVVARKGDEDAGTILVKVNRCDGTAEVYTQARDGTGRLGWLKSTGAEPVDDSRAEAVIARARDVDYDLWVIEVDSRDGRVPFIDHVLAVR